MNHNLFAKEERTIEAAEAAIETGEVTPEQFSTLLNSYRKLFKESRRLVRFSDRTEEKMKQVNILIEKQKAELEGDHEKLGLQAECLEKLVQERTHDLAVSQLKLKKLVERGVALAAEHSGAKLLDLILASAKNLSNADGGTLYLRKGDELHFEIMKTDSLGIALGGMSGKPIKLPPVVLFNAGTDEPNHANVSSFAALVGETVVIEDAYTDERFDFSGTRSFDKKTGYRSKSFLTVPLKPRGKEVLGVLQLLNARDPETGEVLPFNPEVIGFVEALAAQAAVALDNQSLLDAQKGLLDSFIQLIASAIDAKSPYTGGHCARAPELGLMLAKVANDATDGPFADFRFEIEDEWREFRIGAWLHDCGKITTPEHVADKATKLETIYNRIHEVRMRFEVLLRDAEIEHYRKRAEGGHDDADLLAELTATREQITNDFAFVAESNVGSEFMDEGRIKRLEEIAARTWTRHLDDRLGLAHGELTRKERSPAPDLPVKEPLLADRPEHILERTEDRPFGDNPYGFKVDVPQHLYNLGEMYNLRIASGTLTEEERFKINDHVIQTIVMLNQLPLPKHMAKIPEYAGTHHETMDGKGYPCKLSRDEMSVPARIMAIADIFEALTASDRPYKGANTLSEAIRIMGSMRKNEHIDGDLFELFLTSGSYRDYADMFLLPEQIDEVDISPYIRD